MTSLMLALEAHWSDDKFEARERMSSLVIAPTAAAGALDVKDGRASWGGSTALMGAINQGSISLVRKLLDAGANLEVSNNDNDTPAIVATRNNKRVDVEVLKLLVESKANLAAVGRVRLHICNLIAALRGLLPAALHRAHECFSDDADSDCSPRSFPLKHMHEPYRIR